MEFVSHQYKHVTCLACSSNTLQDCVQPIALNHEFIDMQSWLFELKLSLNHEHIPRATTASNGPCGRIDADAV